MKSIGYSKYLGKYKRFFFPLIKKKYNDLKQTLLHCLSWEVTILSVCDIYNSYNKKDG